MTYTVATHSAPAVDSAEKAKICLENWPGFSYRPACTAQLEYVPELGFTVKLICHESAPLARYTQFMDDVWNDSCLEFFVNFAPQNTDKYLNFEMNAKGAWLVGFGKEREGRVVPALFEGYAHPPKATIEADRWSVELFLPLKDMKELFGDFDPQPGYRFLGNFYKCGDETPAEHYLSWHPITSAGPDFHRPECFGTLEIAAQ